jgi:DNA-binding response OmpR family regulator
MNILIVEDEIIPATYLKTLLTSHGYTVIASVRDGENAIQVAKEKRPHIILMDVMLLGTISGAEAAQQIHFFLPNTLIIFLTAYSDKEMVEYAVESEAFGYLLKPYRDEEILATLKLATAKLKNITQTKTKTPQSEDQTCIQLVDGYYYHKTYQRLFLNNQEIHLGSKGLQLIQLLCENPSITLDINNLIDELWDTPKPQQTLRSLIHRVREKTSPN